MKAIAMWLPACTPDVGGMLYKWEPFSIRLGRERGMARAASGSRSRPFTLVVCTACRDTVDGQVIDGLRRAVRDCPHGVMVAVGCLDTLLRCRPGRGLYAAVQPCSADRRPSGASVRLGPLVEEADAEAVGAWLRAGMPDDGTLPDRLRAAPAPRFVAHLN